MSLPSVDRQHHPFGGILLHLEWNRTLLPIFQVHNRLGMRDPRDTSDHDRCVELFTNLEPYLDEILGLLAIAGLQHGNFGELRVISIVLFVL